MSTPNKYLEKISSTVDKKPSTGKVVAEGLVGGALLAKAPSRLLGYHNLYHGTSKPISEKIMKEGFDPKMGGTGSASVSGTADYVKNSSGKVHFSKSKGTARMFAGYKETSDKHIPGGRYKKYTEGLGISEKHMEAMIGGYKNQLNPFGKAGRVLKTRVSHGEWEKFERDPDMSGKNTAATTTKRVLPKSIVGSKDHKGPLGFAKVDKLKKYYSSRSGAIRGASGAAIGIVGTGLLYHAIKSKMDNKK